MSTNVSARARRKTPVYAIVPFAATIWLVRIAVVLCHTQALKRRCIMSDYESVIAAVEEAQRILAVYDEATTRKNQDDFVAMLQFILCNPSVAVAIGRLKSRSRLSLAK